MPYGGGWRIGLLVDRLKGKNPSVAYSEIGRRSFGPYQDDEYVNVAEVNRRTALESPSSVVGEVVRPLLRGLGVADRYLPYKVSGIR